MRGSVDSLKESLLRTKKELAGQCHLMDHSLKIVENLIALLRWVPIGVKHICSSCLLVFFHLNFHLSYNLVNVMIDILHDDLEPLRC